MPDPDRTRPTPASRSSPPAVAAAPEKPRYFLRFTLAQRYLHAVLFTTFLVLAATGLMMRFSGSPWAIRFARQVGGFGAILFFHKFCALVLTLAFLIHLREIVARGIFKREKGIFWGPTSMVANWKDVKDLLGHFRWFLGLGRQAEVRTLRLLGEIRLLGRVLGHGGHRFLRICDVVRALLRALPARLGAQCRPRHPQRRRLAGHPLHLLHPLREHPPAPRQLSRWTWSSSPAARARKNSKTAARTNTSACSAKASLRQGSQTLLRAG